VYARKGVTRKLLGGIYKFLNFFNFLILDILTPSSSFNSLFAVSHKFLSFLSFFPPGNDI